MCGLVGVAGNLVLKDEAAMKRLLMLDYFRGTDSTGLAAVRISEDVHIAKVSSHPLDLFDMSKFRIALTANSSKAFIGHNRAATKGVVSTTNAHPYRFGNIIGAHNGTLDAWTLRDLEEELGEKFPVDSMAIFAGINKLGLEDTISMLTGAWSLTYYDLENKTLNFLRNKERPLTYAYTKDFRKIFWASEAWMIFSAAEAGGYELYRDEKGYACFSTEENIHYSFDLDALRNNTEEKFPKPKAKKIEGRSTKGWFSGVKNTYDPFQREDKGLTQTVQPSTATGGTGTTTKSRRGSSTSTNSGNVIELLGLTSKPLAGYLNKDQFDALAKTGCSWCGTELVWGDKGIAIYQRDDLILCPDCAPHSDKTQNRIYTPNINVAA